eukprot:154373-Chlamydomonas_euryale.AAC.4
MSSSLLSSRNLRVTSGPNATPTPRFDGVRPGVGDGSLHSICVCVRRMRMRARARAHARACLCE